MLGHKSDNSIHYITLYITLKLFRRGLKSKTAKPLNGVSVHGVSVTMRMNERKDVLNRFRKTARVGADVTTCGRLFQRRLPATGNVRSPTVMSRVRRISSSDDDDERSRRRLE